MFTKDLNFAHRRERTHRTVAPTRKHEQKQRPKKKRKKRGLFTRVLLGEIFFRCFCSRFHHFIYLRKQLYWTILLQLSCRGVQDKDMSGRRKVCMMRERVDRMVCMCISHCTSRVLLLLYTYREKWLGT